MGAPCAAAVCAQRGAATAQREAPTRRMSPNGNHSALLRRHLTPRGPRNTVNSCMNACMKNRSRKYSEAPFGVPAPNVAKFRQRSPTGLPREPFCPARRRREPKITGYSPASRMARTRLRTSKVIPALTLEDALPETTDPCPLDARLRSTDRKCLCRRCCRRCLSRPAPLPRARQDLWPGRECFAHP